MMKEKKEEENEFPVDHDFKLISIHILHYKSRVPEEEEELEAISRSFIGDWMRQEVFQRKEEEEQTRQGILRWNEEPPTAMGENVITIIFWWCGNETRFKL